MGSLWACSFAKASLKPKNPRSEWLQYFLKRSSRSIPVIRHFPIPILFANPAFAEPHEIDEMTQFRQRRELSLNPGQRVGRRQTFAI